MTVGGQRELKAVGDVQVCDPEVRECAPQRQGATRLLVLPSEAQFAGAVLAACLISSAVWILTDRNVWWWDQALYGEATLRLWHTRPLGIAAWMHAIVDVLGGQQPLMTWVGQFLVPLRHLTGDFESAMLFVNVLGAGGTLIIVYYVPRRLGANRLSSLCGTMVCAGSGLFIGLTHQYLVEMTQCVAAASMIAVAWGSEKRSSVRTSSLVLAAVPLSFLAKASSMTFVLPMLSYVALAWWITRGKVRAAFRWSDVVLLIGATLIAAVAAAWYMVHWQPMVEHFVSATKADFALHWGSPVNLPTKLSYWIVSFSKSLSSFAVLSFCLAALVTAALTISMVRLLSRSPGEWAVASIANGSMFALALGGTIVATVFAFSLQINEDPRFLLPLVPFLGVLVAWGLSVITNRIIEQLLCCGLIFNAALNHSYSHGLDLFNIPPAPYLLRVDTDGNDKVVLSQVVRRTCYREQSARPNLIVVSYPTLNVNSLNFYASKDSYASGYRCSYVSYDSFDPNVAHALDTMRSVRPLYVVTVAPDKQPPPNFANGAARMVTEYLGGDPHYRLESILDGYVLIYREAASSN